MYLDKWDFAILDVLIQNGCFSKLHSLTLKELNIDKKENTLYKRLRKMEELGYIAPGFRDGKSNTYYITVKGADYFKEAVQ